MVAHTLRTPRVYPARMPAYTMRTPVFQHALIFTWFCKSLCHRQRIPPRTPTLVMAFGQVCLQLACSRGCEVRLELVWGRGRASAPGAGLGQGMRKCAWSWPGTKDAQVHLELAWGKGCARKSIEIEKKSIEIEQKAEIHASQSY